MVLQYFNPFVLGAFLAVGVVTAIVAIATANNSSEKRQGYRTRPRSPPPTYSGRKSYEEIRRNMSSNSGNTSVRSRESALPLSHVNDIPQESPTRPASPPSSFSSRSASPTLSEASTTQWSLMGELEKLCGICKTEVSKMDRYIPPCGDIFHEGCYLDWFRDNMPKGCPTCDFCLVNSY